MHSYRASTSKPLRGPPARGQRSGAAIAEYCGLTWSDATIDIQTNQAASLTASAAQVRRPIYGSSSDRWCRYRDHLQGLIDTLQAHGGCVTP